MNVMLMISCGAKAILVLTRRIFYGKHHYRKFCVESEGFQALSELKARSVTNDYVVSQAIIAKNTEGSIKTLDGFDTGAQTSNDTAVGGLIGFLLSIAGGPLGMMIMGGYGALIGSAVDWSDAAEVAAAAGRPDPARKDLPPARRGRQPTGFLGRLLPRAAAAARARRAAAGTRLPG